MAKSILFNRGLLTVGFKAELNACEVFLNKMIQSPGQDNIIIGPYLDGAQSYAEMRQMASAENQYEECKSYLIDFITDPNYQITITNPDTFSSDGETTDLVNNQNSVESITNHIITPQFNVLERLVEKSELPFFARKDYPSFCKGSLPSHENDFSFKIVLAIPPTIIMLSNFFIKFEIMFIFVEILDPPKIQVTGFLISEVIFFRAEISSTI